MEHYSQIRELIEAVRRRWRALCALRAVVRAALAGAVVIGAAVVASRWTVGAPALLMTLAAAALLAALAALATCFWPLRRAPRDAVVARFIEERAPSLDDRLVSAVDVAGRRDAAPGLAAAMLADAARRTSAIDIDTIVSARALRRAALQAAAAAIVLGIVLFAARGPAREAVDAASLTLFPARTALDVKPGNARIKAGSPLAIEARLVGNRAPVIAQLQVADGDRWRTTDMASENGAFRAALPSVGAGFKYRVVAGTLTSPTYDVTVAYPPRVARIDVDYTYPDGLRLEPRTETDSGDIYAPAGTDVRLHVFTDRPAAEGRLALAQGAPIALNADTPTELTASLKITDDTSYRVALADREGMANGGDTEYFIRILEDRPPDVRILKPASDRSVTRLEEVDVEAQAEDDYGIDRLDLVYSVRGTAEKAVPLSIPRGRPTVTGRRTIYLEDLNVQPGDFISYYVRARDLTRGTHPNEARSDIFFLEVKPYEQEFQLAQSQGGMPGGGQNGIDDLVNAQKEIVVATWKLDRRARSTKGGRSEQDIHSIARAEAELKTRVEQTSSTFRESTMRDPRKRPQPQRGRSGQPPPPTTPELKAGQTLPEEDHMTAAATAMGNAVVSLDALKTTDALPPEMEALDRLLKAQADVKKREVSRQQAGSGAGNNRSNYDMSALFDKELQKAQQTNYETKSTAEQHEDSNQSALDKVKDLARRQDELLRKQQELAQKRAQMTEEELRRELEKLTRDQLELRQKAEELARQMQSGKPQSGSEGQRGQRGQQGQQGQQGQAGQAGQAGQSGQSGQAGQSGQSGQSNNGSDAGQRLRDATDEMRNAANDLRRQDPGQASARGNRALEALRQLQQQLESARPDDRRRAVGDMQLEARQLADAQRQIASELGKTGQGDAAKDTVRRLAGEEERLAERTRRLEQSLKESAEGGRQADGRQADGGRASASGAKNAAGIAAAAGDAAKEIARQKVADRMQQASDAMRAATEEPKGGRGSTASRVSDDPRAQAGAQQELARALDKVADRLASATGAQDGEAQKLSDQRARAQALRDKLNGTARQIAEAGRGGQSGQAGRAGQAGRSGAPGQESGDKAAGENGKPGQAQGGGAGGTGSDLARLRDEYQRQLQETKDFMDQLRRDDPSFSRGGGGGFTFESPDHMTLSAPGTEAFKQDFAKWEEMRRQATQALENAEASISKKLQAKQAKDRLAAGADDKPPAEYQKQVDSYFKAIASKKKP